MSAFGNDCHFYYNSTCIKGDSCPFRHCEAAKASDVTCTFWRQKTCTKPNCSFRHTEGVTQNKNRADIPCYWETQPSGCTKAACPFKHQNSQTDAANTPENVPSPAVDSSPAHVEVQPVVVNLAEDSDVEMTSPVKAKNTASTGVPRKAVKQLITVPSSETNIPPQTTQLRVNKLNIKNRLTAQGPDPGSRKSVKERLKMGVPDTSPKSVRARLGVQKHDTSIKNRLGTQQGTSGESTQDDSGEDSDLEVKSLEQIQREKALRSMGLIELKGGKIMKIADWEKEQREQTSEPESKEEEEEESEEDEEKEETDEEEKEGNSEEEEVEDDLEEPEEIELFAPEEEEHVEDTRTFVSTEDKTNRISVKNLLSEIVKKNEGVQRGGRRIVVEDKSPVDDSTPDLKASLKRRLGGKTGESFKSVSEPSIKKRLTLTIGSSNQGTVKTITGIKSRLGTLGTESTILDARQKLKQKQRGTPESITMSITREPKEENSNGAEDGSAKLAPIRKRGWRRATKVAEGSDTDNSRPVTPDPSVSAGSPEKSSVTEESVMMVKRPKKEEDGGAKLQNMLTQRLRNTVWSNRNNQRAKAGGETLDSLGIGIIDIKGGKVVKMGKDKEEGNTQVKREDKLLAQIEKLSKVSKREIKERKVYVPPALQKAGIGAADTESDRGRANKTEAESDLPGEDSSDLKVKTFSEIMAAKRQRQKRLAEKKNAEIARKKSTDNLELPQENTEDSNEAPADVLKIAQMITGSIDSSSKLEEGHHRRHHHSKKKSKWRKKLKESKERKDKVCDNDESSMQETEKTLNYAPSEDSQNSDLISDQKSLESGEPAVKKTKHQKSETLEDDVSDKEEISPAKKRAEQLLSDSWLDLDVDNTEGETGSQDEDDLLREIDELLA